MRTSQSIGLTYPGDNEVVLRPREYHPPSTPVIYSHGAEGGVGGSMAWMNIKTRWPIMRTLSQESTVFCGDLGGNATWGNDVAVDRQNRAADYVATLPSSASTNINGWGQSMGGLNQLVWAGRYRSRFSKLGLIIPVINLTDVHANSGYASDINSAYSGGYSEATYGALHNPLTMAMAGAYDDLPILLFYGNSDALCKPEFAIEFASYCNNCQLVELNGGHTEEIQSQVDLKIIQEFFGYNVI